MAIEESRSRLSPLLKILDDDDDNNAGEVGTTTPHNHTVTSISIVKEFSQCIDQTYASVDMLLMRLADGGLIPPTATSQNNQRQQQHEENVYFLMASNCISKASNFIGRSCLTLLEADSMEGSGGPMDDHESANVDHDDGHEGIRIQPCMARLAELALRVCQIHTILVTSTSEHNHHHEGVDDENINITPYSIIEAYSQYQRRCLRTRSKPAISIIADLRREATSQQCFVSDLLEAEVRRQQLEVGLYEEGDDENVDDGHSHGIETATVPRGHPHAHCLTVILGEVSSLIQPLAAWRDALNPQLENDDDGIVSLLQQLCQQSIELLDTEAQTLAATVGSWFSSDQRGIATLDKDDASNTTDATKSDLLSIEASLEEMAWLCQLISRYCLYSEQTIPTRTREGKITTKLQDLLTEQSLHYSTLETRLAKLQFSQALSLATPQLIEIGRPLLQVPSIVEDAHFICLRAIERASGTRSDRAVWTVGHWVCEVWGVDHSSGVMGGEESVKGVYRALMEGVGCSGGATLEEVALEDNISKPAENAFAAALLKAVDEDGFEGNVEARYNTGSATNSAPSSGGLTSFFGRGGSKQSLQSRIDAELCALNGISAAETACSALSGLFSDLVEEKVQGEATGSSGEPVSKSPSMLTFARDELSSHSRAYRSLLQHRVRALVNDLGGGDDIFDCDGKLCLQNLRLFIESEVYNLDGASFRTVEGEDRIESQMIGPIRRSQIFEEIRQDKCDAAVVMQIAEAMSWKSAEIVLRVLLQGNTRFTEWGALLLSKQLRMLQNIYCGLVLDSYGLSGAKLAKAGNSSISTASILTQFERVNQAVSILQLEKPSDWLAFSYKVGESGETNLTGDEIQKIMSLRVDFSEEAIARVCIQIGSG